MSNRATFVPSYNTFREEFSLFAPPPKKSTLKRIISQLGCSCFRWGAHCDDPSSEENLKIEGIARTNLNTDLIQEKSSPRLTRAYPSARALQEYEPRLDGDFQGGLGREESVAASNTEVVLENRRTGFRTISKVHHVTVNFHDSSSDDSDLAQEHKGEPDDQIVSRELQALFRRMDEYILDEADTPLSKPTRGRVLIRTKFITKKSKGLRRKLAKR